MSTDIEPLRGIARGAAWLFNPEDEADMERAIRRMLSGEPAGAANPAKDYSWTTAAQATLRALRSVL